MDAHDATRRDPLPRDTSATDRSSRGSSDSGSLDLLEGYGDHPDYPDHPETQDASETTAIARQPPPPPLSHAPNPDHHTDSHSDSEPRRQQSQAFRPPNDSHHTPADADPYHVHTRYDPSSPPAPPGNSTYDQPPSPGRSRSQTLASVSSLPRASHVIKRKPLSSTASHLAIRFSAASSQASPSVSPKELPKPETRFSRAESLDSPTFYEYPAADSHRPQQGRQEDEHRQEGHNPEARALAPEPLAAQETRDEETLSIADREESDEEGDYFLTRSVSGDDPSATQTRQRPDPLSEHTDDQDDSEADQEDLALYDVTPTQQTHPQPHFIVSDGPVIEETADKELGSDASLHSHGNSIMSVAVPPKPTPPHLNLERVDNSSDTASPLTTPNDSGKAPDTSKPLPKSPSSSKFGTFFSWGISPSPSNTEFSSLPSPLSARHPGSTDETAAAPQRTGSKTNASSFNPLGFLETNLLTPPAAPTLAPPVQIQEMEDELKDISAELAASIRREMDLEDLVDRLQSEVSNPQAPNNSNKRTSDYFSDSGVSSTKFSEYDHNKEEVEKIQRRADQEKASIRLELTNKVTEERSRRKLLDRQIKELSEKASQIDLQQVNNLDAGDRVKELERTCEDLRRRLSEEKKIKDNFEDLLTAMRSDLQNTANERDNLRDEIVPQLRARVEGLEAEASDYSNLTYESTKMQQELQSLKNENKNLRGARAPSESATPRSSMNLSRSNSVTASGFKLQKPPSGLSRSNTVKAGAESREILSERLKDVEAQRDALHSALRNLLDRQDHQNRENEKKIKILEMEKERLLAGSPAKAGFEQDVSNLRHEIKVLRRRAEEALEHKWQAEKGLGGLKMDLDRAEEEIASLRSLLQEKDILLPPSPGRASTNGAIASDAHLPVTSESLEASFQELQISYQQSLEKIRTLEAAGPALSDEQTQLAFQKLETSLSSALFERDAAKQVAATAQDQAESLRREEAQHVEGERQLAVELRESARRVEELATQVRQQLADNTSLRQRLADAVARGEADRRANAERITTLQGRLRTLEEALVAAQTSSEERCARHEEQIRELKEADNLHLRRPPPSPLSVGAGVFPRSPLRSPALRSAPGSRAGGLSPMPSPGLFPASPGGGRRGGLPKVSVDDEAQVDRLRARVSELESTLAEAESEMQQIVAKMSSAQIEVLALQEEREAAVKETKRVQRELEQEKVRTFEERFRTLSGNV